MCRVLSFQARADPPRVHVSRGPVIWGAMPTWESEYLEWKQRRDWLVSKEFVGDDNKDEDTQQVAQEDDEDEDEVSARDGAS